MDGSALSAIDALPSCHAISKHPRAAGYRGSDFVPWHTSTVDGSAATLAVLWGEADTAPRYLALTGRGRDAGVGPTAIAADLAAATITAFLRRDWRSATAARVASARAGMHRRSIRECPTSPKRHARQPLAAQELGKYPPMQRLAPGWCEPRPIVEKSLELSPNSAHALDTSGSIIEALGRREEAADFRRAHEVAPNNPTVQSSGKDELKRLGVSP